MNKPLVLVVDDEDCRHEYYKRIYKDRCEYIEARDAYEAIEYLKSLPRIDLLHLDYDLFNTPQKPGKEYLNGYAVVDFVLTMPREKAPERYIVHSWNWVGHAKMMYTLRTKGYNPISYPYPLEVDDDPMYVPEDDKSGLPLLK